MEKTIFDYLWQYSWRQQLVLVFLACASFPFLYGSLELPKVIVNDAIGSSDFPKHIFGFDLEQIEYLLALCFAFLAMVFLRFGLRYFINVYKGVLAERMLRRLRYQLFTSVLRFRCHIFGKRPRAKSSR